MVVCGEKCYKEDGRCGGAGLVVNEGAGDVTGGVLRSNLTGDCSQGQGSSWISSGTCEHRVSWHSDYIVLFTSTYSLPLLSFLARWWIKIRRPLNELINKYLLK